MTFLDLKQPTPVQDYTRLGLTRNPFPPRGAVYPDIYLERSEATKLLATLERFLLKGGQGSFFALDGRRGMGKSNLLQYIDWQLKQAVQNKPDDFKTVAWRYVPSQLIQPRQLAEQVMIAVGQERLGAWLGGFSRGEGPDLPEHLDGTDLWRFLQGLRDKPPQDSTEATQALMRWLAGFKLTAVECRRFKLWSHEALVPAIAFSFMQSVVGLMIQAGHLRGILLLLDEAEDLVGLQRGQRNAYMMALKALLNSFNFSHLFVVIAGQGGALEELSSQYSSLGDRWHLIKLKPVGDASAAVELAKTYRDRARLPAQVLQDRRIEPSDLEVEAIYHRAKALSPNKEVTQRDLLDELHDWVEREAAPPG